MNFSFTPEQEIVRAEARRFFGNPPALPAATERDYLTSWPAEDAELRYRKRLAELAARHGAPSGTRQGAL